MSAPVNRGENESAANPIEEMTADSEDSDNETKHRPDAPQTIPDEADAMSGLCEAAAELVAAHTGPPTPALMLASALMYARDGFAVFPLTGKLPAIPSAHPKGTELYGKCKGGCGKDGHGHNDATTDPATICRWWASEYKFCNIGLRPPPWCFVLDTDPRAGGEEALAALAAEHGEPPLTKEQFSGRGDGGRHLFYRKPAELALVKAIRPGLDIKGHNGFVVAAPSVHPRTLQCYTEPLHREIAEAGWLLPLAVAKPKPKPKPRHPSASERFLGGGNYRQCESIADKFCETTTWAEVLMPHGWDCVGPDSEGDGAVWRHPAATSNCSATLRHDCLFVYSTNTPFDPVGCGGPNGYTKFRAYATLSHRGDLSAAAKTLLRQGA